MVRGTTPTALVALFLLGCPTGPVEPDTPSPPWTEARVVSHLAIAADGELTVPRGESVQLSLAATFEDLDEPVDVSAATVWRVADPDIATVNPDGSIEGVLEGFTTAWGEYAGIPSAPLALEVVRGRWNVEFADGSTGVQGKLLDVELLTNDTSFASADDVVLTVDGLVPFGMERVVEPWWGVPDAQPNRYRARFLVPPTATPGPHDVVLSLDGRAPENSLTLQITANTSFGTVRDCDYFANEPASNWSFQADGNNSRSWLMGDLATSTNTRILAESNSPGGVDPYLALWSLTGGLLATSDDDPEFGNDGGAGLQVTSLEDVFEGAYYVTATVSPEAIGNALGGTIATDCSVETMPGPMRTASNDAVLFGGGGTEILPGSATEAADFAGVSGTVTRVWVYLDVELGQPDFTTFTLTSPAGTPVEILSPNWSADWLPEDGVWSGALGGDTPFVPVAEVWANPSNPGPGTAAFAGESATGTWSVGVNMAAALNGGSWRDARIFIGVEP
ncbi:MAG: hypothetical protein KDA24_27375 [Deltaproteobacteria bacterium]|nr:hypothetical protein [Deltaproteobacteria bacterium]